jgi:MFS superfamily sulfate permease-like transporter
MKNKTTIVTSVMGTIAGIAGFEHGVGEIMQGNVVPPGIFFESWPDSKLFANMAGEPAMSLIPNMIMSGIIGIIIAGYLIYWAITKSDSKYYGFVFLCLSFLLLMVGGGFGPPLLGIILGSATLLSRNTRKKKTTIIQNSFRWNMGDGWKGIFFITLALWLFLFPIFPLLSYTLNIENGDIIAIVTPSAFLFLALSYVSANIRDQIHPIEKVK